jgi:hypothetical protein
MCGQKVEGDQKVCALDGYCTQNSVYSNNPHKTDDLKMAITEYIQNVDRAILKTVFENTCIVIIRCTHRLFDDPV